MTNTYTAGRGSTAYGDSSPAAASPCRREARRIRRPPRRCTGSPTGRARPCCTGSTGRASAPSRARTGTSRLLPTRGSRASSSPQARTRPRSSSGHGSATSSTSGSTETRCGHSRSCRSRRPTRSSRRARASTCRPVAPRRSRRHARAWRRRGLRASRSLSGSPAPRARRGPSPPTSWSPTWASSSIPACCGFPRTTHAEGRANVPQMRKVDKIRVLIVDDHAVVRSGIRLLLSREPDIEPVGEAGTGREAVFEARTLKPNVILMDIVMPDQTGLEALPTLLHENPEVKVLLLSMQDDPRYVREAFAAGASGYVLKEAADAEVVNAVREVAHGGRYVNPELGARLVAAEAEAQRRAEEDPLSEREREVLRLLALGHTNQEIARQLYISVRTAETHRAHIMQKLRLASRADLVRYALAEGLLERGSAA